MIGHGSRDSVVLPTTNYISATMNNMSEPSSMNIINNNTNISNNINDNNPGVMQRPQVTYYSSNNNNNNNNNNNSQSITQHAFNNQAIITNNNNTNNNTTTAPPNRIHAINKRRPQSAIDYNLMSNNNSTNNNNNSNSNNNIKQNSALNFKMNATTNDVNSIRNFIDMRTLLASTTTSSSSYNRPLSAPLINQDLQDILLGNAISTAALGAGAAFGSTESSIYNKLKNTSSNLMNFEGKQRNDNILPVETIYTTGDTGARRYGVPAFRPRSSSAQRPSAVDRALNINSNNRNNSNSDVKNAFFPSPLRGGLSSSNNNNNNLDVSLTRPLTGSQYRAHNNNNNNNDSNNNNNKQAKLSEMLEGNIIERLDHALGRR